jgi:hypothetical protein
VGYWFVPFKGPPQHYSLDGGTMLFSKGVRFRNEWENHRKIFQKYSRQADQISKLVKEANHLMPGTLENAKLVVGGKWIGASHWENVTV